MSDPLHYPKAGYGRNINSPNVLIIGAGISGLCIAIDLIKGGQGRNFVIVEKGNQVGGTWNDNIYPGCCCDVLSHLYSFSFEPNPNWSREYPRQEEILEYIIGIAHKYELYRQIRFCSRVEEARWDGTNNKWRTVIKRIGGKEAEIGESYTMTSDFLVSAVGQLNCPKYPDIPGLRTFNGKLMHSARWDWDYDIRGKRVGIIGTGATAAQIIPEISQSCEQLVVFQRTPAWVMPRHDDDISPTRKAIYKHVPIIRKRYRASIMDHRESVFEASFHPTSATHSLVTDMSRSHMHTQLAGKPLAKLREHLTPDYPFSCKRIIVSDDFYPALTDDSVCLEVSSIDSIDPIGVKLANGSHHALDLLILATGFRTTHFLYPIQIYGSNGASLQESWLNGALAYLGITVEKMPNFAMLYGPNTNLAYNSLILQIEAQSLYIIHLIAAVLDAKRSGKTLRLEPKHDIVDAYNQDIQARLAKSTYADPTCTNWFRDEHGRITTNWAGSAIQYQERTSILDWSDYELLGTVSEEVERKGRVKWKRRVEETVVSDRMLGVGAALGTVLLGIVGWFAWARRR